MFWNTQAKSKYWLNAVIWVLAQLEDLTHFKHSDSVFCTFPKTQMEPEIFTWKAKSSSPRLQVSSSILVL